MPRRAARTLHVGRAERQSQGDGGFNSSACPAPATAWDLMEGFSVENFGIIFLTLPAAVLGWRFLRWYVGFKLPRLGRAPTAVRGCPTCRSTAPKLIARCRAALDSILHNRESSGAN